MDAISPVRIPQNHSIRERISRAEDNFRHNQHRSISEDAAVDVLNTLADAIGAPAWAYTNLNQLHVFRLEVKADVPLLVGTLSSVSNEMSPEMSPLEAVVVTLALANRKITDSGYQVVPDEWVRRLRIPGLRSYQNNQVPLVFTTAYRFAVEQWLHDETSEASRNAEVLLDRLGLRR